ncbi:hypothetical protein BJY52DRAFT_1228581 [Lactarius psammicola]|nr:hypothetical protein BJY52DRAFT_1228581 [Lactarius psammicola]
MARPSRPRPAPIVLVARGPVIRPRNGSGRWTSFIQTGWGSVKTDYFPAPGQAPPAVQGTDAADTGIATRHRRVLKKQPSPQAVANQDTHMATLEESVKELTESHKKLMGTQKQLISMMLAVCSHLGIKVTMPDDSTVFAVVRSTVSSIPSPLVDDVSALSIGRAPASAAPSVASASSARSSMRSGTSAFRACPLSTVGGGSHHGSAAVSCASSRGRSVMG